MDKVLIISKNISFIKNINNVLNKNSNYILSLCSTFKEAIYNIKENEPSYIILELNLEMEYFKNLVNCCYNINNYNPIIIVTCKTYNLYNDKIYYLKNINVIEQIKSIFNKKNAYENFEKKLENNIFIEMNKLGFDMKNKGDLILLEVIKYIKMNDKIKNNLIKDIYPIVSRKLKIPISQIKYNITYSINSLYLYKFDKIEEYLNQKLNAKPTPKYIIYSIIKNI